MDDPEELHQQWHVVEKISGEYHVLMQDHSPFDVAAWHGNCLPYKTSVTQDMLSVCSRFAVRYDQVRRPYGSLIWTLLAARSRDPNVPLDYFIWFGPRWDVAMNSFRLPYFIATARASSLRTSTARRAGGAPTSDRAEASMRPVTRLTTGVVQRIGSHVTKVEPGHHLVMVFSCGGECKYYLRKQSSYCDVWFQYNFGVGWVDGSKVFSDPGGEAHCELFLRAE
ncbi:homogentisate 1,2-dioxygenase [Cladophialophora bantiana CBS 173.52]|uniref:homogentisate 1,2-dioxygenase n=1 Tax=Cladophialophora bantiana (strain ATCC 10958 / CBS 173.52 / CDC B-1940 / NIH 8579) TaxID=1442370 RepID=A0A0D2HP01_CLAB1|nr:homogentisate 1,2-dioxygenase [Cladophialophora bantiana CBS 173.52]KIW92535.1 homogentisate 1,2-dioxygenase [Cladophialophora bantiana CBS 173.52]